MLMSCATENEAAESGSLVVSFNSPTVSGDDISPLVPNALNPSDNVNASSLTEESDSPIESIHQVFPAKEAYLKLAMDEAGLDWIVIPWPGQFEVVNDKDWISHYLISDPDDVKICSLNMYSSSFTMYNFHDKQELNMSFLCRNHPTTDEYNLFLQNEWYLFWSLAGTLLESSVEINILSEVCFKYFEAQDLNSFEVDGDGWSRDILEWEGKEGGINAYVRFEWSRYHGFPILASMIFYKQT